MQFISVDSGHGASKVEFFINGKELPNVAFNGLVDATAATPVAAGAKRQVYRTRDTGGKFQQQKAVLLRLKKGTNTLKVMVPTIKKEKGMDLRGMTLKPVR